MISRHWFATPLVSRTSLSEIVLQQPTRPAVIKKKAIIRRSKVRGLPNPFRIQPATWSRRTKINQYTKIYTPYRRVECMRRRLSDSRIIIRTNNLRRNCPSSKISLSTSDYGRYSRIQTKCTSRSCTRRILWAYIKCRARSRWKHKGNNTRPSYPSQCKSRNAAPHHKLAYTMIKLTASISWWAGSTLDLILI